MYLLILKTCIITDCKIVHLLISTSISITIIITIIIKRKTIDWSILIFMNTWVKLDSIYKVIWIYRLISKINIMINSIKIKVKIHHNHNT